MTTNDSGLRTTIPPSTSARLSTTPGIGTPGIRDGHHTTPTMIPLSVARCIRGTIQVGPITDTGMAIPGTTGTTAAIVGRVELMAEREHLGTREEEEVSGLLVECVQGRVHTHRPHQPESFREHTVPQVPHLEPMRQPVTPKYRQVDAVTGQKPAQLREGAALGAADHVKAHAFRPRGISLRARALLRRTAGAAVAQAENARAEDLHTRPLHQHHRLHRQHRVAGEEDHHQAVGGVAVETVGEHGYTHIHETERT